MSGSNQFSIGRSKGLAAKLAQTFGATFERYFLIGILKHRKMFEQVKDRVCPYDPRSEARRLDFSDMNHNRLFEMAHAYWFLLPKDVMDVSTLPIDMLETFMMNLVHVNKTLPADRAVELFEGIKQDLQTFCYPEIFIAEFGQNELFNEWLSQAATRAEVNRLHQRQQIGKLNGEDITLAAERIQRSTRAKVIKLTTMDMAMLQPVLTQPCIHTYGMWPRVDEALGGWNGCVMVGGVSGGGKTVVATQLASQLALHDHNVAFVTTEQPFHQLVPRMVSNVCSIPFNRIVSACQLERDTDRLIQPIPPQFLNPNTTWGRKTIDFLIKTRQRLVSFEWIDKRNPTRVDELDAWVNEWEEATRETASNKQRVIIFDWVGGTLSNDPRATQDNGGLRMLYMDAVDKLVDFSKRKRLVIVIFAQLDTTKAINKRWVDNSMLSESKTMVNGVEAFIGITCRNQGGLPPDAGTPNKLADLQYFCVGKSRFGPGGPITMVPELQYQRWKEPAASIDSMHGSQ